MKSINDGSGNKTLNNVHRLSEMAFAVKRVIKVGVLHDDKCSGVVVDHMTDSDDTLKVFIPRIDVDPELLKSKFEVGLFNCHDIKAEESGISCKISRMNERKALLRQIRRSYAENLVSQKTKNLSQ